MENRKYKRKIRYMLYCEEQNKFVYVEHTKVNVKLKVLRWDC